MHHCSCGQTWTGTSAAHCAKCHVTFSALTNFDKHISGHGPDATHRHPTDVGLALNERGTWTKPMDERQRARIDALSAREA